MAKKMGLGRGLSAILPDVEEVVESVGHQLPTTIVPTDAVVELPLGDIDPNRDQPRKKFDDEALAQLADSIRHSGVLSPILVARDGSRYTIIAGERRWRAARLAGIESIPAIVREWDEIKRQEAALIENIQREHLNPIDEAQGIFVLMNECALTQEQVSQRLGRSRPAVANLLRLLGLPAPIQQAVIDGAITAGHARVLAGVTDKKLQATQARREPPKPAPLPVEYEELRERLRSATGLKVSLSGTEHKGKIVLEYGSQEELQRLWDMLGE